MMVQTVKGITVVVFEDESILDPLQVQDIGEKLHRLVADETAVCYGVVEAFAAFADGCAKFDKRLPQRLDVRGIHAHQVQRQALGALGPNARQALELLDYTLQWWCIA